MNSRLRTTLRAALGAVLVALAAIAVPAAPIRLLAESEAVTTNVPDPSDEIVFIGGDDNLIRVLDLVHVSNEVKWISPEGDFREVALGDVNNDGDMEIIAIRGDNPNGEVVIYDPVISSGGFDNSQKINDIPWAKLATVKLAVTPTLILAGDFDPNVPGDEFVVGGIRPGNPDEEFELNIYKNKTVSSAGKEWDLHVGPKYFDGIFSRGSVGNVIMEPTLQWDEFAMINEDGGVLMAYSMANGFDNILTIGAEDKRFLDVDMGQWSQGTAGLEIVGSRDAFGLVNVFYWEFIVQEGLVEKELDTFDPAFRRVTMTDVNANGDDELYLLRDVPAGVEKPRLVSRNSGNDGATEFEEELSDDNAWRALSSGDVNGDGKGDVIVASATAIRVYNNAARDADDNDDYNFPTNRRSITAGNLDAVGFVAGPEFEIDKSSVVATARINSTADALINLKNTTTSEAVPFVITAEGSPSWLSVNGQIMSVPPYQATGNTYPNNVDTPIQLRFDAAGLSPGVYRSRLTIDSSADVTNKPISAAITFNVLAADFKTAPGSIYVGPPCTGTVTLTQTTLVTITGLVGLQYNATVLDGFAVEQSLRALEGSIDSASLQSDGSLRLTNAEGAAVSLSVGVPEVGAAGVSAITWPSIVPWVSASSVDGVVNDTMTVTTTLATLNDEYHLAYVLLFGDPRAGSPPQNIRLIPIVACANSALLPAVMK